MPRVKMGILLMKENVLLPNDLNRLPKMKKDNNSVVFPRLDIFQNTLTGAGLLSKLMVDTADSMAVMKNNNDNATLCVFVAALKR